MNIYFRRRLIIFLHTSESILFFQSKYTDLNIGQRPMYYVIKYILEFTKTFIVPTVIFFHVTAIRFIRI